MLAVGSCGAFVAIAEPLTIVLLRRVAAMDVPNQRSSHTIATPRGGGAPIAVGLTALAVLAGGSAAAAFALAVGAFGAIGFADDLAGLSIGRRLILQAAASIAASIALARQVTVPQAMVAGAAVVIAVWLAAFVNVFNFMDGVNGIAGVHAAIGGAAYACLGLLRSNEFLIAAGGAVAAGALAFLPWNAVRARVFLGDVGSYALGAALAVLAVRATILGIPAEATLGPLALFLADASWTLQRRIRAGEPWLHAHRTHIYQQWCDLGWSHQRVTVLTAAGTLLLCLLGMVSLRAGIVIRAGADAAALGILAAYLGSSALIGRAAKAALLAERA